MARRGKKIGEDGVTGEVHIARKVACYPSSRKQANRLERCFGSKRYAFNWALGRIKELLAEKGKISFEGLRNELVAVAPSLCPWINENPKDVKAEAVKDAYVAFKNFMDSKKGKRKGPKMGFPRPKKKGRSKFSFRLPGDRVTKMEHGQTFSSINLSVIGRLRLAEPVTVVGRIIAVTVSRKGKRFFISFAMAYTPEVRVRRVKKPKAVGGDFGLGNTLTLSNGEIIEGPKPHKKALKKLARLNRGLHRKVKGSKNRRKHADKVDRFHSKIADVRKDFIEKTTTRLLKRYDVIGIEDLSLAGMMRTRSMARSAQDNALGAFAQTLERKSMKYGCLVVKVDRFFPSSKNCRKCGSKNQGLELSDRVFKCPSCGHTEDRDIHAAKNILNEALRLLPRATGEFTPVEIRSLPKTSAPKGTVAKTGKSKDAPALGKPRVGNRKGTEAGRQKARRSALTSNADERQNSVKSASCFGDGQV